jgi:hypothetical protein
MIDFDVGSCPIELLIFSTSLKAIMRICQNMKP